MLTRNEVRQICNCLALNNAFMSFDCLSDNDLSQEILCIVYRTDVFEMGDNVFYSRHIDVEYIFGDFYEINEKDALFQYIFKLCKLPLLAEKQEIVIYEKTE